MLDALSYALARAHPDRIPKDLARRIRAIANERLAAKRRWQDHLEAAEAAKRDGGAAMAAETIIKETAAKHQLTAAEVLSKCRKVELVQARQEIFYRLRAERGFSFPVIARLTRIGDHTTVIHGVQRHAARAGLPYPARGARA